MKNTFIKENQKLKHKDGEIYVSEYTVSTNDPDQVIIVRNSKNKLTQDVLSNFQINKNKNLSDPVLECNWTTVLPVYNSAIEKNRVKKINPNLVMASYPLTREFLNNHFNENKFGFSNYSSFIPDCAASMYSFFIMTFGYAPGTGGTINKAIPAVPGGQGISYGFNPFFGLFDINNPILWILLAAVGIIAVKKITE